MGIRFSAEMAFGIAQGVLLVFTAAIVFHLRRTIESHRSSPRSTFALPPDRGLDPLLIGLVVWAITRLVFATRGNMEGPGALLLVTCLSTANDMFFLLAALRLRQAPQRFRRLRAKASWRWSFFPAVGVLAVTFVLWAFLGQTQPADGGTTEPSDVVILWWLLPASVFSMTVWLLLTLSYVRTLDAYRVARWLRDIFLLFQLVAIVLQPLILSVRLPIENIEMVYSCLALSSSIVFSLLVVTAIQAWLLHYASNPHDAEIADTPDEIRAAGSFVVNTGSEWTSVWTDAIADALRQAEDKVRREVGTGKVIAMADDGKYVVGDSDLDADREARAKFGEATVFFGRT